MHQAVLAITRLEQQLQEQNIKPMAYLKQSQEGEASRNSGTVQDSPSISTNKNTTPIKLNVPQQFCSSLENLEQVVNTSMAMISIGAPPTSSSDKNSLIVSVSKQDKVTPPHSEQNLHQLNVANNAATLDVEKFSSSVSLCDTMHHTYNRLINNS